jgi:acetyl-CoA decarbonylase/synthase, CODH/ACS complex subunit gamma
MNGQERQQEKRKKKNIREISPIDVYKYLPKTNCGACQESNCMAFATRVVNGELMIEGCPPLLEDAYSEMLGELKVLLAPPVRVVTFGEGEHRATIGGKYVLQRHEFTYHNPSPIAIEVHDLMPENELIERVRQIERFSYNYIGRILAPDAIAIRSTSHDPDTFRQAVKKVAGMCSYPFILCSLDPAVMEAGLSEISSGNPLIYAATKENWRSMADLALDFHAPLVVSSPGDLSSLRTLTKTLLESGISDLVLDPGTLNGNSLPETIGTFTLIRTEACRYHDELFGFPLLGAPVAVWTGEEISEDLLKWREAITASILLTRYADLLIMHSLDGWVLLPQLIWRFNLYTDPRKPVSVEGGVKVLGNPDRTSPVLLTTNYALTYFTVESDIKAANLDCFLVVVDTGGLSVESAVAGRILTAESIASALETCQVKNLVDHTTLIIPGLAARISGETEETTGWQIRVGPKDSSGLSKYICDHWPLA